MPQLLDLRFTTLADTPSDYTGNEGDLVRVNSTANALEFVAPEDLNIGAQTFIDLTDTPANYASAANKLVRVTTAESGLEFVTASTLVGGTGGNLASPTTFTDLTDTPNSYTGANGQFVQVSGSTLVFVDPTFISLPDTPATYSGQAGKQVVVNSGSDGLIFTNPTDTFLSLSDTPDVYGALDGGRVVLVKQDLTGLEFKDFTFTALSDTPDSYTSFANNVVKVNGGATGLVFAPEIDTFLKLTDTPAAYGALDGGKLVRVKSDRTGLEFASPSEVVSTSFAFTDLTDAPDNYTGAVGKYVQVKADTGDGKRLQFADAEAIAGELPTVIIELKLYDENYTTGTQPIASGANSIAIGEACVASGANANVAGGQSNVASGQYAVVAGGRTNTAASQGAAITGGQNNTISSGTWHTILAGTGNSISNNSYCGIVGGTNNTITGLQSSYSTILGGQTNRIETSNAYGTVRGSTIIGGKDNQILRDNSLIAGGTNNTAIAPECLILGGANNYADADYGTIIGGQWGTTRKIYNAQVYGARRDGQTKVGEAQTSVLIYSGDTAANAGFTKLLLDGGSNHGGRQNLLTGYCNRVLLPTDPFTYIMKFWVVGRSLSTTDCASFEIRAMVRLNGSTAQTPCDQTKNVVCKTSGASNWDAQLTVAAGTAGQFSGNFADLEVTGGTLNVRWVARLETVELVT
jgi:hypothetical protein